MNGNTVSLPKNVDWTLAEPEPTASESERAFYRTLAEHALLVQPMPNHEVKRGLGRGYAALFDPATKLTDLLVSLDGEGSMPLFSNQWCGTIGLLPVPEAALNASPVFNALSDISPTSVEAVMRKFCKQHIVELWESAPESLDLGRALLTHGVDSRRWTPGYSGGGHFIGVFEEKPKELNNAGTGEELQPFVDTPPAAVATAVEQRRRVILAFHSNAGQVGTAFDELLFRHAAESDYILDSLYRSEEYRNCVEFAHENVRRGLALLCEALQLPRQLMGVQAMPYYTHPDDPSSTEAPPDTIDANRVSLTTYNCFATLPIWRENPKPLRSGLPPIVYYNKCSSLLDSSSGKLVAVLRRPQEGLYAIEAAETGEHYAAAPKHCVSAGPAVINWTGALPVGQPKMPNWEAVRDAPASRIGLSVKHNRIFYWPGKPDVNEAILADRVPGGNWRMFAYRPENDTTMANLKRLLGATTRIHQFQPRAECIPSHETK